MKIYEYTEINRVDHPHNYMYSEFGGEDFILAYLDNRKKAIEKIGSKSQQKDLRGIDEYFYVESKNF